MAEFSEVSRGYIRMCESCGETCEGCPISACSENDIDVCRNRLLKNPKKYEDTILKWAAEHPEPRYPTFGEWLCDIGELTGCGDAKEAMRRLFNDPIPAEFAEKLEIEPKEK